MSKTDLKKEKEIKKIQKRLDKIGYFGVESDILIDRINQLRETEEDPLWRM